jgi:hypothetical protein
MSTKLYGELGSTSDVEISAVGNKDSEPDCIGMLIRDVTARSRPEPGDIFVSERNGDGDASLEHLVRASTEAIERQSIATALEKAAGNRTAAILGRAGSPGGGRRERGELRAGGFRRRGGFPVSIGLSITAA